MISFIFLIVCFLQIRMNDSKDVKNSNVNNSDDLPMNFMYTMLFKWQTYIILFLLMRVLNFFKVKYSYHFAYSLFVFILILCCVLCTPITFLRPKHPLNMIVTYPFACVLSYLLGVKCELRGKENLARDEAGVMVVNHQSSLDVMAHCRIMNVVKRCVIVSRQELLYFLPYSIFMTLAGSVFIDRKGGKSTSETLLNTCPILKKYKAKLLIYPEGTRTLNADKLKPFKKGGFRVAITAQIPILPTVISPFYFIDSKNKRFDTGKIIIKALEPIPTVGLTLDDIDTLIEKTWKVMSEEYENLKNEIIQYKADKNKANN